MTPPFPNSYWLEPGRILCGEYPRDFEDGSAHEKMTAMLEAGVRVFLDLTEKGEKKPYRHVAEEKAAALGIDPTELTFHRHAIPDVSVPRSQEEMRDLLRTIRLARHQNRILYIHCWGGKGRTGTVAGCALRDLFGLDGGDALSLLTDRWQTCAKSAHSRSPETEEQRGFVRSLHPVASQEQQIRGALLGAAVGDALGVPVEFAGRQARENDPVTDMREYGTHQQPMGTWSDDTSMILATMEGLLTAGDYSPVAVMREFASWVSEKKHTPHGTVFDIGNATWNAIDHFRNGKDPSECGGTEEWSNGNGSLMRILPIALAYRDDPDLIDKASEISALTHAHERSRLCCAFYCLVVSELLHGEGPSRATAFAWEVIDHRWEVSQPERTLFDGWKPERLFAREESEIGSSGHVVDTLEASLWVNARHDNYEAAVLHAVNLGDDTDTTGCVAGGVAGLIHGQEKIPAEWRNVLVKREDLADIVNRFAKFCVQEASDRSLP